MEYIIADFFSRLYNLFSLRNIPIIKFLYGWNSHIGPFFQVKWNTQSAVFCLCHRKSERSIRFFGVERYLCSRCLGVLIGGFCGNILYLLGISSIYAIVLIVPLIIDGITQALGWRESTNILRLITGFLSGIGIFLGV